MASENGKSEKKRMKMRLQVLDKSDEELKIKNFKNIKSRDASKDPGDLFLLNVENEITAYSISKQNLESGPKPVKRLEERDFLSNLENEITIHAICKPKETVVEKAVPNSESRLNAVNMGRNNSAIGSSKEDQKTKDTPSTESDNGLKSKETNSVQPSNDKSNGPTFKLKKRRHSVEDTSDKEIYVGLEYLLEDEEIVLQNKAAEKYIVVDKGRDDEPVVISDAENRVCDQDNANSSPDGFERKRRRFENQRSVRSIVPDGTVEDAYVVLWESASNTRLPSLLWSVHKAVDGNFVAFSHISPYSSDLKFVVDKVIMFGKDRRPVVFLRGVKVTIPSLPEVLESPEHIGSALRRVDRLLLCLGYDEPMEKHSAKCSVYFERVGNSLTCNDCLIERKILQTGRRKERTLS